MQHNSRNRRARRALAIGLAAIGFIPTAAMAWTPTTSQISVAVFGGTNSDFPNSIAVDSAGNIYTTGYFSGTVDFDPGSGTTNLTSAGGIDVFVSKLNATGDLVWAKTFGGTGNDLSNSVAVDGSGTVYTTGRFSATADFDPGAGTTSLTSAGGNDVFVSKLNAAGDLVWAKSFGGTGNDESYSLAVDSSGNVHTTGYFYDTVDFDPGVGTVNATSAGNVDAFVSKLNSSGELVWAKTFGSTDTDQPFSVKVDASGNVYTTGRFSTTVDFDPGAGTTNLTAIGGADVFVSKLNAAGGLVWAKSFGSTLSDSANSVAVDNSGNVYTTGYFYATADFDPGAGTTSLSPVGGYDVFVSKLSPTGGLVWAKSFGGTGTDVGYSVAVDSSGNVHTTGYFYATADFDPGAGTTSLTSAGSSDIFISKLNSAGDLVWAKTYGDTWSDDGMSVAVDGSSNVYTAGRYGDTVDFDSSASTAYLTSAGNNDVFVLKLDALGSAAYTTTTTSSTTSTSTSTTSTSTSTTTVVPSTSSTTSSTSSTTVATSPTTTPVTSAPTTTINVTASTTASTPTATTISSATTVVALAGQGQNSVTAITSTTKPSGSAATQDTIAPTSMTQMTSTSAPQTALSDITVPDTEVGGASALIGGVEVETRVTRENNELRVNAGSIFARIWATTKSGGKVPLDVDGRLRLQVGDSVTVNVEGLDAATPVEVRLYSDPVLLGRTKVDATGTLGAAYEIPERVTQGNHSVVMLGTSNGDDVTLGLSVAIGEGSAGINMWVIAVPVGLAMLTAVLLPVALRRRKKDSLA